MDDKMKAKCYRLDYNELGLSTLCVEKDNEIERLKEEYMILQNASDEVEEEKDKEIERLKDLCNKYEEEHKTTFEEWKKAINIIKEVRETIEKESFTYEHITGDYRAIESDLILEILDKVGEE